MDLPDYVVSFDPGGSNTTWAYCVSRTDGIIYEVLETGYAPVFEDIAKPNSEAHLDFLRQLNGRYPKGRIDLVAERYISRTFNSWLMEYIGFGLGWWTHAWTRGTCRYIMPAQWKKFAKKYWADFEPVGKYADWWELAFCEQLTDVERRKHIVHKTDATCMGWFYWHQELGTKISVDKSNLTVAYDLFHQSMVKKAKVPKLPKPTKLKTKKL